MTDCFSPQTNTGQSASESLRCLTRFLREIGQITNISTLAERILTELLENARCSQGSLYIGEQERQDFYQLAAQGVALAASRPPMLAFSHPLVHMLAQRQEILSQFSYSSCDSHIRRDTSEEPLEHIGCSLAIPLVNRGRLVAFALLWSEPGVSSSSPENTELLTAMAQSGANSLDSLLAREGLRQCQHLMHRTDRLRLLETMAEGFVHEIRNPLTSIKTFVQLTPERQNDTEFIREFSHVALDGVHHIERLIEEILHCISTVEPQPTEEDLNTVVSSCLYFLNVKARRRGIEIQKELASGLPRVMLNRQQIKQVLLTLFLTAMDAMKERGGTLRVKTKTVMKPQRDVWVQIEIEDTGHGISTENLEHGFIPFFAATHKSMEHEDRGLGLSIARQIIREHRGTLHVRNTEGIGTAFRINLPSVT